MATTHEIDTDRNAVIARIRAALRRRSGRTWSVTGGTGTAWGWIEVNAPPARRTAHWVQRPGTTGEAGDYDNLDTGVKGGHITPADAAELAGLLELESIHFQGASIPASSAHYTEYVDRAEGRTPRAIAQPYWD
jgi:hypothetical protein